jgi:hypothetical protein
MSRSDFNGSGKNDAWFALFFIVLIVVAGLIPRREDAAPSSRPAPVPADQIKE